MADGVTVANAFVQIMPSAEGATSAIEKAIMPGMEDAGAKAGGLMGDGLMGSLKGLAAKLGPILGAGAIAKGLFDIGSGFDEMTDNIIMGTGASGDALAELQDVAKAVATTVPVSFGQAGDYIQNLNTRLGLTGQDLQDVATNVGALESMVGSVNLDTLTGTFNAFNVEAGDMTSTMDYLFGVTQSTGIGFDQLTGILEANAPSLQNLGFTLEESANMAGLLDRAGIDASGTMGRMGKALVELAGEGGDAGEAFNSLLDEMQGYIDAGDTAAAIDIATNVFGTKGAAQFVGAVQSGALALDDLKDAALGAGDGIMGTYEQTADWAEKWEVLKNKFAEALEPLAGFAFDVVGEGVDLLSQAFDELLPAVEPLISVLGDTLTNVVMPALGAAFETFGPIIMELSTWFVGVAADVIGAVNDIAAKVAPVFQGMLDTVTSIWQGIKSAIEDPIGAARDAVGGAIDAIRGFFNFEFHWPHIPLPHFSISGSINPLDWLSGGLPSISVDWYAKGGVVDGATLIGAGERGAEGIVPLEGRYMRPIAAEIAKQMGGGTTIYLNAKEINSNAQIRRSSQEMMMGVLRKEGML